MKITMNNGQIVNVKNDDDDEIVKEIPIFHCSRLQDRLYSFRYPLQSKKCRNQQVIQRGFYKPRNQEIQLDMEINVQSRNFDSDRAEIMAQDIDGPPENRKTKNIYFENDLIDKVSLKSLKTCKEPNKYAAMVYNGREIHLTTLKGVFQFRPHFPYLEKSINRKRKDQDDSDKDDDEEAGPSSAEQITVKFKQGDDRWNNNYRNKANFKTLQTKSEQEPWIKCNYQTENSALSKVEKLKLFSENIMETKQAANLTDLEYLKVLIPDDQEEALNEPNLPSHIMSLHALRALPIAEQCRQLLKDAQIIQFQQLLMILAGNEGLTADILLRTLPKVAVLVRGNWVVKSDVLYPENTFSSISGVPAELMCRTRDYVLYLFTKNQYVERKKISSVMKIPSEEVKEIFTGFSKLSRNKGWELLLGPDLDFIMKHSEIVHRQNEFWEQRFKQLVEYLKDNTKRQRRKSKSISEDTKLINKNNVSSDNESGTEKNKSPIVSRKNKKLKEEF